MTNQILIDLLIEMMDSDNQYVILEDGFEIAKGTALHLYASLDGDYMESKEVLSVLPSFVTDDIEIEIQDANESEEY